MNESLSPTVQINSPALSTINTLLSQYLAPEYHALFSGLKKLAEKAYAGTDSSVPIVALETNP